MKISVVLPTRGLVFTEVERALEIMRTVCRLVVFRSYDLGIPDAQNTLVEKALSVGADYILFIEEDTVPPKDALQKMIDADADIAFIDYGVNGWSCSARETKSGEILWCGLGCTLVKREVFSKLEKPYFRTDKSLRLNDWVWINNPMKYGGQDIWFFVHAREAGFKIAQVEGECKHMQIDALGTREINNGRHLLSQKTPIERQQIIDGPELTNDLKIDNVSNIGNSPMS